MNIMMNQIISTIFKNNPSLYIYGSVCLNDFKYGWSDIDILCLTEKKITDDQAEILVDLRQALSAKEVTNKYYRLFEGGFLTLNSFIHHLPDTVVYWGTSGQRITDFCDFDSFSMAELIDSGRLLYGKDIRSRLTYPSFDDLKQDIEKHYMIIRKYATNTSRSIYSAGWLLDIARGLYTLQTGKIISKSEAGKWALKNHLCPDRNILSKVVEIRENPQKYKTDDSVLDWCSDLGIYIQRFADVLEQRIRCTI